MDEGNRLGRCSTLLEQIGRQPARRRCSHERHQRAVGVGVRSSGRWIPGLVAADDGERGSMAPIGHRNAGQRRAAQRRGQAGNDGHREPSGLDGVDLFPSATEHERIAAFQSYDVVPCRRPVDQQRIDRLLRRTEALALADRNALRRRWGEIEQRRVGKTVVDDDIGCGEGTLASNRDEIGAAGARSDQRHRSGAKRGDRLGELRFEAPSNLAHCAAPPGPDRCQSRSKYSCRQAA